MLCCLKMKIGVFDSGIGGVAVAEELQRLLDDAVIIRADDHEHVPYGGRPESEIIELTKAAIAPLLETDCDAIVLACNTATTAAIDALRAEFPHQKFVGLEPMVKPAVELSHTKTVAVLATPSTLNSKRYAELKKKWATGLQVLEPNCSDWASLIENGLSGSVPVEQTIKALIQENADVIVLGCTHYHLLKEKIQENAGQGVTILEPSNAIKSRLEFLVSDSVHEQQQ